MIDRLDHINFSVLNLQESMDWYQDVFGFTKVEGGVMDGTPWAIMRSGNAMLAMYERKDSQFIDRHETKAKGLQGVSHFAFNIKNLSQWIEKVEKGSVLVDHYWKYPHSQSWYVNDPTGYEIEVVHWDDQVKFDFALNE